MDSSWPFAEFDADSLIYDRPKNSNKRSNTIHNQEVSCSTEMSRQFQESSSTEESNITGKSNLTETENGIDWHRFLLLKLPKGVIEDVARLMTNIDRRHLSQTCRRIHSIFHGSVAQELDRRHVVSVNLDIVEIPTGHEVEVQVCYDQYKKHFSKFYKGLNALGKCGKYLRQCSRMYAMEQVSWKFEMDPYWPDTPSPSELVAVVPDEGCGRLHIECPQILYDSERREFHLKMVRQFLEKATFSRLMFNMFDHPSDADMVHYMELVEKWCSNNDHSTVISHGYFNTGFCKRILNGKRYIVMAPRMDREEAERDVEFMGRVNGGYFAEDWHSGPVELPETSGY